MTHSLLLLNNLNTVVAETITELICLEAEVCICNENYPLTRNYYENSSLRIIVKLIKCEIRNFPKIIISNYLRK